MSIIEQAVRRLEELQRAGVAVPWAAAGASESEPLLPRRPQLHQQPHPQSQLRGDMRPKRTDASAAAPRALRRVDAAPTRPPAEAPFPRPAVGRARVTLDLERLGRAGWLEAATPHSTLAEEFRQLKRPLLRAARGAQGVDDRLSMIMITSACAGEGKTFTAINLAMSMALEIDTSVLLVDADVVRADVPRQLGFEADKGLLDLLVDPRLAWRDLVVETNVPKLSILPAGTRSCVSTELLASDAMESLLVSMSKTGGERIVIFDGPPLLVTSEARTLASRVGQVLLVVEAYATPRRAVAQALTELEGCAHVMSMLNRTTEPTMRYGYGEYGG